MTNTQIILNASLDLMEAGVIKGTGNMMTMQYINEAGEEVTEQIEEPEAIHTYATWKQLGYQVRKGEKAKAAFSIWKCTEKKAKDEDEEPEKKMFMKKAFWFTFDQVEPIKH